MIVRVSALIVKFCGSRVHFRSSMSISPSFFIASVTASTNVVSDGFVHDAKIKLRHVAKNALERFILIGSICQCEDNDNE